MNQPEPPDFTTWSQENLARFALEAWLKMQTQRELLQSLRQLLAGTGPHP